MPYRKALAAALWMAVPVAAGAAILLLEGQNAGSAEIRGLLEGAREPVAAPGAGPDLPADSAVAAAGMRPGHASPITAPRAGSGPVAGLNAPPRGDAAACDAETDGGIAVGDTVTVRFFEDVAPTTDRNGPVTFERRDLAASEQVARDGTVVLPALGRVEVFARRPACLERELARRATERLSFTGRVSVAFAARPAALVRGAVLHPGSYAYDPALTPTRLVTLAGHPQAVARIGTAERNVLTAQATELRAARTGLVLYAARLNAVLDGVQTLSLGPEALGEVTAALGPEAVEMETELLRGELRARREQRAISAERAKQADERIERLRGMFDATEAELTHMRDRRDQLSTLLDTGAITSNRLDEVERSLLSLERERLVRASALEDARMAAEVARQDARMAETDWRGERMEALRDADLELTGLEARIAGLEARTGAPGTGEPRLRFTLERVTPDGLVTREIGADAILMPGDLVTVSLSDADATGRTQ